MRARVKVAERQGLDVCEQIAAHVLEHELAHASNGHRAVAQREFVDHNQAEQPAGQHGQFAEILVRNRVVNHNLGQVRDADHDAAHRDHDRQDAHNARNVRFEIFADASDVVEVDGLLQLLILAECIALCHKSSSQAPSGEGAVSEAAWGRDMSSKSLPRHRFLYLLLTYRFALA